MRNMENKIYEFDKLTFCDRVHMIISMFDDLLLKHPVAEVFSGELDEIGNKMVDLYSKSCSFLEKGLSE
jgi:hypothetical protein